MFCMSKCDNDTTCNGYSIDYSNNGCFLSSCNLYTDVPTCSTCLFASKKNLSSFPSCPSYTDLTAFTTTSQSTILTYSTTMTVSNTFLPTTNHPTILKTGGTAQDMIVNSTLCVCVCNYVNQTVEESTERRRKELTVNKTQISSFIRKLTSATDDRKVSELIGTVAIIIMVIFGLIIACADICSVLSMRFSKRTNCRKETHL